MEGARKPYGRVRRALNAAGPDGTPVSAGQRVITRDEINQAKLRYAGCRCEDDYGLMPGLTLKEVNRLGAGCKSGSFVCPVLDSLRRMLGH